MCNICVWLCVCDMHVSVQLCLRADFLRFGKVILINRLAFKIPSPLIQLFKRLHFTENYL